MVKVPENSNILELYKLLVPYTVWVTTVLLFRIVWSLNTYTQICIYICKYL